jgi:hypothetical protein
LERKFGARKLFNLINFDFLRIKPKKESYLLLSLAVSDILKSLFSLPMGATSSYFNEWKFDQWGNRRKLYMPLIINFFNGFSKDAIAMDFLVHYLDLVT